MRAATVCLTVLLAVTAAAQQQPDPYHLSSGAGAATAGGVTGTGTEGRLMRWGAANAAQDSSVSLHDTNGAFTQTTVNGSISFFPNGAGDVLVGSGILQIGGTTGSFPAVRSSGQTLEVVTANEAAYANLTVGSTLSFGGEASIVRDAGNLLRAPQLRAQRPVTVSTSGAGAPLVVSSNAARTLHTNEGAAAEAHFNLPGAAEGWEFLFCVQDADGVQVNAAAGDTIRLAGSVSAVAGNVESTAVGSCTALTAVNATEWFGHGTTGTWTVN